MNDVLQILGTFVVIVFLTFALAGKSPRAVVYDALQNEKINTENNVPTLLSMRDYIPPSWSGTTGNTNTTVIDGDSHTTSGTVFVSATQDKNYVRSNFENSATNDTDRGDIVIAAKQNNLATASVINATGQNIGTDLGGMELLIIVMMLIILVVLARITTRKHNRLKYQSGYYPRNTTGNYSQHNDYRPYYQY